MMDGKMKWKIIGLIAILANFGIQLLADYAGEKQQDEILDEKITKRLAETNPKN